MSVLQEEAVQMINDLSDDNVSYLIDFMKRFMIPGNHDIPASDFKKSNIMGELEDLRLETKEYFPNDFDATAIWEEAMDEKYGHSN